MKHQLQPSRLSSSWLEERENQSDEFPLAFAPCRRKEAAWARGHMQLKTLDRFSWEKCGI
jgi:hypothetical protein